MKLSVSLPEDDVAFLDRATEEQRYASRSAAVAAAVRLLREQDLEASYVDAFGEWIATGDGPAWDSTAGDGLVREAMAL
jgi:Arc/MetJ-type ribon-helix-helix transcriptional regulator